MKFSESVITGVCMIALFSGGGARAQTTIDLRTQGRDVDFSGAGSTIPAKVGAVAGLPPTCAIGAHYFATDGTPGRNIYYCTALNTWTLQATGASAMFTQNGAGAVPRTVTSLLQERISVKDFGACAAGSCTDAIDTAAFNAAIAYVTAQGGGTLFVPPGTYNLTGIVLASQNIVLKCAGTESTILNHTGTGDAVLLGGPAAGFYGLGIEDCTISGNASTTNGLHLFGVSHGRVSNVRIKSTPRAFLCDFCISNRIDRVRVSLNEGGGGSVPVLNGMTFTGPQPSQPSQDNKVTDCYVEGVWEAGFLFDYAVLNSLENGTSEGNGNGITLTANAASNWIANVDFEANDWTGIVNTNGVNVSWIGGQRFFNPGAWLNQPITIGNVIYTVANVADGTHLTLTTSAGVLSGVNYFFNDDVRDFGLNNSFENDVIGGNARVGATAYNSYFHRTFGHQYTIDAGARWTVLDKVRYGLGGTTGVITDNGTGTSHILNETSASAPDGVLYAVPLTASQLTATGAVRGSVLSAGTAIGLDGPAGIARSEEFRTGGLRRWSWYADGTAESGGNTNVGSNLHLGRYNDDGSLAGNVLDISRSTGALTMPAPANTPGSVATVDGAQTLVNKSIDAAQITTGTLTRPTTGNAATATALAATPATCLPGNHPLGVDASGNALNCTVDAATGTGPYSQAVNTYGGDVVFTHGLASASVFPYCFDNSSPPIQVGLGAITANTNNQMTIGFPGAFTGTCYLSTGGMGPRGPAGAAGTNGTNGSNGVGFSISNHGAAPLPVQPTLNFTGAGVVAADNPAANRTDITIAAGGASSYPFSDFQANVAYTATAGADTPIFASSVPGGMLTAAPSAHPCAAIDFEFVPTSGNALVYKLNYGTPGANTSFTVWSSTAQLPQIGRVLLCNIPGDAQHQQIVIQYFAYGPPGFQVCATDTCGGSFTSTSPLQLTVDSTQTQNISLTASGATGSSVIGKFWRVAIQ